MRKSVGSTGVVVSGVSLLHTDRTGVVFCLIKWRTAMKKKKKILETKKQQDEAS